jgi:hypothetical protein
MTLLLTRNPLAEFLLLQRKSRGSTPFKIENFINFIGRALKILNIFECFWIYFHIIELGKAILYQIIQQEEPIVSLLTPTAKHKGKQLQKSEQEAIEAFQAHPDIHKHI